MARWRMILVWLVAALLGGAARGESSANKGASVVNAPVPNGPYEQTPILRKSASPGPATRNRVATSTSSNAWEMGKMPLALCAVILLILGMRALGKKMVPGAGLKGSSRAMQVVARSTVSPRQQLMLIQVGRRLVMVGCGGAEMRALCEIGDADEVAEVLGQIRQDQGSSVAKNFRTLFGKAGKEYEEVQVEEENAAPVKSEDERREELLGLSERVRRISERFG